MTLNLNLFFEDRAHGEPIRAMAALPVPVARIQPQIATDVASVGRCRPVVAEQANFIEGTPVEVATAGRGEKHIRIIISP